MANELPAMNGPRLSSVPGSGKNGLAGKTRCRAKLLFDAQQLIVFRDTIGARSRSGFDLSRSSGYGKIRDEGVFGLAGAMRNDGFVSGLSRQFDGVNRFGHAANLVQLDQNRVGDSIVDAAREPLRIRYKQIVADQLNLFLRSCRA